MGKDGTVSNEFDSTFLNCQHRAIAIWKCVDDFLTVYVNRACPA